MANIYWNTEKAPFDEAEEKIKSLVIECTDSAFFIKKHSGDCGTTMNVYAETEDTEVSPWSTRLPTQFMGWRVIMYRCPVGYIGAFLDVKEKDNDVSNW
mgnify:FL=1|tara:strand:+ start:107 stop:403 length:297 start_codon:yes stop_codon:yes gene_type:complete